MLSVTAGTHVQTSGKRWKPCTALHGALSSVLASLGGCNLPGSHEAVAAKPMCLAMPGMHVNALAHKIHLVAHAFPLLAVAYVMLAINIPAHLLADGTWRVNDIAAVAEGCLISIWPLQEGAMLAV